MPFLEAALTHGLVATLHATPDWRRNCTAFLKAIEALDVVKGVAFWLQARLVHGEAAAPESYVLQANRTPYHRLRTVLDETNPTVRRMRREAPLVIHVNDPLAADLGVDPALYEEGGEEQALVLFPIGTSGWLAVIVGTEEEALRAMAPEGLGAVVKVFAAILEHRHAPLQTLAQQTRQVKEQFLANMSHEMRTPLNVIQGMAHLLMQDEVTKEQEHQIRTIHMAADDLLQLINQVLSYAQLEADDLVFRAEAFYLRPLLADLGRRFKQLVSDKGLTFALRVELDVPDLVVGDAERLKLVLYQLLSNTVKFTEQGYIHLNVAYDAPSTVHFEVIDTGVGIAADRLPYVFTPFVQAEGADDRTYGGTGLGLSMVQILVEGMKGTISVESAVGEGTTFRVRLPLPAAEERAPRRAHAAADIKGGSCQVLVVEDNLLNQEVVGRMLERWGVTVLTASSGAEALDLLAGTPVDAVLMDLQMPGMDGYTTAQRIRSAAEASLADVPIIAITASVLGRRHQKLAEVGINAFLTKPFGPHELRHSLYPYLELDRAPTPEAHEAHEAGSGADYRYVNLAHMRDNAFGNTAFMQKVLDICLDQLPTFIEQLDAARADADWKTVAFVVHKMKSTTSTVGAEALTAKLQAVEAVLKNTDADLDPGDLQLKLETILEDVQAVLFELENERRIYA